MEGNILIDRTRLVSFKVPVNIFREGDQFVADCVMLGLASHGKTEGEARRSMESVIEAFLEEVLEMGTLADVLTQRGWRKGPMVASLSARTAWVPPKLTNATVTHVSS